MTKLCKSILSLTIALGIGLASASPAFAHVVGDINASAEMQQVQEAVGEPPVESKPEEQAAAEGMPAEEEKEPSENINADEKPAEDPPVQEPVPEPTPEPIAEAAEPEPVISDTPALLPDGTANVVDYAVSESGKEFFIIQTANGNNFYLVLDKDRQTDNVYMLSPVDEADLMDFVGQSEAVQEQEPVPSQPVTEQPAEPMQSEPASEPASPSVSPASMGVLFMTLAVAGGAGYYLKVVKPRQERKRQEAQLERMEFDDDPVVNEDQPPELYVEDEVNDSIE